MLSCQPDGWQDACGNVYIEKMYMSMSRLECNSKALVVIFSTFHGSAGGCCCLKFLSLKGFQVQGGGERKVVGGGGAGGEGSVLTQAPPPHVPSMY